MNKTILGLDLGSNSIGWALMNENNNSVDGIINLGVRIFNKSVEDKVPTPKNVKRREMRLGRRVLQRRARRKQKMINYLILLKLLPTDLEHNFTKEKLLNEIGNPYELRTKALDKKLTPYEFGRVLLHFSARRGFLSSKKQVAGDLIDDPDTIEYLKTIDTKITKDEEGQFKADINDVYQKIKASNSRTLGEYLYNLEQGMVKRNRNYDGGHLRTDRAMYKNELKQIWQIQEQYFNLPSEFISEIEKIIFYQRPLKLDADRVGKCSLEKNKVRAKLARLEVQRFRYLQDINNLTYFENQSETYEKLDSKKREKLRIYFEKNSKITITKLKNELGLGRANKLNLEVKNIKGNITACKIHDIIGSIWDNYDNKTQEQLVEDLLTIKQKSSLKARLITHWDFDRQTAVKLCLLEFEAGHSNHCLKVINKLLPFLELGDDYSKARENAGYDYIVKKIEPLEKLPAPPETSNPIVNKALHELRRVVNAIIKQHGKPKIVRIEMARDLEMNTKRYKNFIQKQNTNQKANEKAEREFLKLHLSRGYASRMDKIRYRLWQDQNEKCAYSGKSMALNQVWSSECEVDHILPFKKSLDDSYMNKVLCFVKENRNKSDKTPVDVWGGDNEKWNNITQMISKWDKGLQSKVKRFYTTGEELKNRDFASSQLNDTRYISKLAQEYLQTIGCKIQLTKGSVVAKIRHQWGFNSLLGDKNKKERTDHRHHTVDAVIIAATSLSMYQKAAKQINNTRNNIEDDRIDIAKPYSDIRKELQTKLDNITVSHDVKKKLSGSLHEETGAGYIKKHGGLVYRKTINKNFTIKNAMSIVDSQVKTLVLEHIENYDSAKVAFNDKNLSQLKLGKNLIKRVRVLQSKTTENKLQQSKFGVKDQAGKVFKYMAYGNIHHIEIIKNIKTNKIKTKSVTMMEATCRLRGINRKKEPVVTINHGDEWEFLMALYINDIVSIDKNDKRIFYRVQKFGGSYDMILRLHTASTIDSKAEVLEITSSAIIDYDIRLHKVNAIGYFLDD